MKGHQRLMRIRALSERLGVCYGWIYGRVNPNSKYYDPSFPKQIQLAANSKKGGRGAVAWDAHEVEAWIESRKSIRSNTLTGVD